MHKDDAKREDMLLKLYEHALGEQHYYLTKHYTYINLYTGLLSALVGATVLGFVGAKTALEYIFLCFGPASVIIVSLIAIWSGSRSYQAFLEAVSQRAKLEYRLRMMDSRAGEEDLERWWISEPLVATRHIASRDRYRSSLCFVEAEKTRGMQRVARVLFGAFTCLGTFMLVFLAAKALATCVSDAV